MKASHTNSEGFTLIELLVVSAITVLITGLLVSNFSRARQDLTQTALILMDAIREPQALALSGAGFGSPTLLPRCGYGIHFLANGYTIYAGPDANPPTDCSTLDRRYNYPGSDTPVRTVFFSSNVLEIAANPQLPPDIFFEPPDPTTYIDGKHTPPTETTITLQRKGATCAGQLTKDCRIIHVTTAGLIEAK